MYTIYKEFHFEAAHHLPQTPVTHKCHGMHGHSYKVTIFLQGQKLDENGWLMDFGDIKSFFKPLEAQMDHKCLNDIPGLENPTSEVLAKWLYDKLKQNLPLLSAIKVQETASSGCTYRED